MQNNHMYIGIDARFFGSLGKGLGRYTQKLIQYLETIDKDNQYFVFLRKENFDEYRPQGKNFQKVLADYQWYSFSEQLFFPRLLKKYNLDLMHFPHFNVPLLYRKKFVLTIHDLILVHFPTVRSSTLSPIFYWLKFAAYRIVIRSAIRRAQKIFAVSEFTKKDILETYKNIEKDKITVTYEACESDGSAAVIQSDEILKKHGIMKPYLLYVGNAYPHKNLEKLVDAFERVLVAYPDMRLVFVGKEDFFYARLKEQVAKKNIKKICFLGFVGDQELDTLYQHSAAYVFPSLYEGFGLPPLEAMAKGAAVISSDRACMREILGDAAYYVDAENSGELTNGIITVLNNENLRLSLVQKGYERIKRYSWDKMARQTLEIYKSIT